MQLLSAIEALIQQILPRVDEPDFIPDHRVPQTVAGGLVVKKPKKPKKPKVVGGGKAGGLGRWMEADEPAAPPVKAVRKVPSFGGKPKGGR